MILKIVCLPQSVETDGIIFSLSDGVQLRPVCDGCLPAAPERVKVPRLEHVETLFVLENP